MAKVQYDFIVAQMAATIAGGIAGNTNYVAARGLDRVAEDAVRLARAIVAEVERAEQEEMEWQPMSTAPKDREFIALSERTLTCQWSESDQCWLTHVHRGPGFNPQGWKEKATDAR